MSNLNDYSVWLTVHEAHHREALAEAFSHNLAQRTKNHRPTLFDRIISLRPALKIDLGVNLAQECALNPAVC